MSREQISRAALPQSVRDRLKAYVFARDGYVCQLRLEGCTGEAEEPDHIIPRSPGGGVGSRTCGTCRRHAATAT